MKTNYHIHTYRCKHAKGDVHDFCQMALLHKMETIGISDHSPLPDNRWLHVRMPIEELSSYCSSIDSAQKNFPEIKILKGMECDYAVEYESFYREELLEKRKFDYLIGAVHWFLHENEWLYIFQELNHADQLVSYAEHYVNAMESGLFSFMAHPDLFINSYAKWDQHAIDCSKAILQTAASLQMPLEINSFGFRRVNHLGKTKTYPLDAFWEMASDYGISVLINSDAHQPEDITSNLKDAFDLANKYNLNIIDSIE